MLRKSLMAALLLVASATGGYATDLLEPVTPEEAMDAGFDWEGAYIGVDAGRWTYGAPITFTSVGAHIGTNFVYGSFLFGLQGDAAIMTSGVETYFELFANARAGVLVSDNALIYGIVGLGSEVELDFSDYYPSYQVGGGIEFALNDALTVQGQVTRVGYWESSNLFDATKVTVGFSHHL